MTWKQFSKTVATKEVMTFLLFLVIAAIMWLMYTIGTQREIELTAPVAYYGVPDDISMRQPLPETVTFVLRDEGSHIWEWIFWDADTIDVDLTDQFAPGRRREVKVAFEPYVTQLVREQSSTCEVSNIDPAVYQSKYEKVHTRRVPVRLARPVRIDNQYMLVDSVVITPATVRVRGDRYSVDTIQAITIEIDPVVITKSKSFTVKLVGPKGVDVLADEAKVEVKTERATEKSFRMPIEMVNVPDEVSLRVFPKEAEVICRVGLSRFNSLNADRLSIVFDYEKRDAARFVCPLSLKSTASLDGIEYRIEPREAEYLIEQ